MTVNRHPRKRVGRQHRNAARVRSVSPGQPGRRVQQDGPNGTCGMVSQNGRVRWTRDLS